MTLDARFLAEAEKLSASFPPLMVEALRIAATVAQGLHGRRVAGPGESFWQFRAYEPTDPARMIDWRKSAKGDDAYVREREWEAAQTVFLWCDRSASMDYVSSSRHRRKQDYADLLWLALSALLLDGGERVALLGSGLPPFQGASAFGALAVQGLGYEYSPVPQRPLPQNARVLLISDFLFSTQRADAVIDGLGRGRLGGDIVQVMDVAETTFPFGGHVRFEGTEDEAPFLAAEASALRAEYIARLDNLKAGLDHAARCAGLRFHHVTTQQRIETVLLEVYMSLHQGARRGGPW